MSPGVSLLVTKYTLHTIKGHHYQELHIFFIFLKSYFHMVNFPTNQADFHAFRNATSKHKRSLKKSNSKHTSEAKFLVNLQVEKLKFSQSSRGSCTRLFYHKTLEMNSLIFWAFGKHSYYLFWRKKIKLQHSYFSYQILTCNFAKRLPRCNLPNRPILVV